MLGWFSLARLQYTNRNVLQRRTFTSRQSCQAKVWSKNKMFVDLNAELGIGQLNGWITSLNTCLRVLQYSIGQQISLAGYSSKIQLASRARLHVRRGNKYSNHVGSTRQAGRTVLSSLFLSLSLFGGGKSFWAFIHLSSQVKVDRVLFVQLQRSGVR